MTNANPEEHLLYSRAEDLHPSHWEVLGRRLPEEVARASGATWDGDAYTLPFLSSALRVSPGARTLSFQDAPLRRVGYQRALVAVAYLGGALDAPPSGAWVAFRELPGGEAFFRGPHSLATPRLVQAFGERPRGLAEAARALGGCPAEGGDAAVDLPALPQIPLRALLWKRTDEFAAEAALLVDSRAYLHVALDVLWALSNLTISDLVEAAS